ncbi:MAG: GIY-YIG nuclease family protein [Proteobacteria bacterium]|nr:GIY-YIG nuclease family protein [Pseudomonadota bacterium]
MGWGDWGSKDWQCFLFVLYSNHPGEGRDPGTLRGDGPAVFYVYLLASRLNGTLYVGSTGDLRHRVDQHKAGELPGFTAKYGVDRLVWYETHPTREDAFRRERQIKEWKRVWKIHLIERDNPNWRDLAHGLGEVLAREEMLNVWREVPGSRPSPG